MSWTTAEDEVRTIISDGDTDKLAYRKKVIGVVNGTNITFKTFEIRRVSALLSPTPPAGVFDDNGAPLTVASDDQTSGEFTLSAAPVDGTSVVATYYFQWFLQTEIQSFLKDASNWIGNGDDWTTLDNGLQPAAREFAAHKAYQKLVSKMAVNLAETYQLYDAPDQKRFDPIAAYSKISKDKYDLALKLRNDVYDGRKGVAKSPIFSTIRGMVRDTAPNR